MIPLFATLTLLSADAGCAPSIYVVYRGESDAAPELLVDGASIGEPARRVHHSNRWSVRFETTIRGPRKLWLQLRSGSELSNRVRIRYPRWTDCGRISDEDSRRL